MGCGSSAPSNSVSPTGPEENNKSQNNAVNNGTIKSRAPKGKAELISEPRSGNIEKLSKQKSSTDDNANSKNVSTNNAGPKGGIAFDVSLDGRKVNSLIMKHPPKRLQRLQLEPLDMPKMTPEMLIEKQKQADEKRRNELQKRRDASQKTSKRRRELVLARQFEQQQETEQQIESQQKTADKLREAKQRDIIAKQKMREERARRVREKAKRLQTDECEIPDLEKDETFNADDIDSWDEDTGEDYGYDSGERIYSGHGSPKKRAHGDSGIGVRNVTSAGTTDSFDNAFMNDHQDVRKRGRQQAVPVNDDFFDT